jgi:serine/threonine protein kinase
MGVATSQYRVRNRSFRSCVLTSNGVRDIGRYALYAPLGAGGMASVHLGRLRGAVGFARTVAIKRLHDRFASDPEFVAMFLDEARLAGRIRHPSVVPTLDVVVADGELFVVMEYVHGETLAELVHAPASGVPLAIVSAIVSSILHGLEAVHDTRDDRGEPLDIVHRDVSPQNVLVGVDGVARVLDFGIAKALGRLHTTRDGALKGKVAYMAPEQLKGLPLDRRADVYAAAVVLFEVITSRRLFVGQTEDAIAEQVLSAPVTSPSAIAPHVSPELDAVVMRGLSRDRNARFRTAREMAVALERAVPAAPALEVGAWVESRAGEQLARRAGLVREAERDSASDLASVAQALEQLRRSGRR